MLHRILCLILLLTAGMGAPRFSLAQTLSPCEQQWFVPELILTDMWDKHPSTIDSDPCFIKQRRIKKITVYRDKNPKAAHPWFISEKFFDEEGYQLSKVLRKHKKDNVYELFSQESWSVKANEETGGVERLGLEGFGTKASEDWLWKYDEQGKLLWDGGVGKELQGYYTERKYESGKLQEIGMYGGGLVNGFGFFYDRENLTAVRDITLNEITQFIVKVQGGQIVSMDETVNYGNGAQNAARYEYAYDAQGRVNSILVYRIPDEEGKRKIRYDYKISYDERGLMETCVIRNNKGEIKMAYWMEYEFFGE
jgi:hypothetical protein